MFLRLLLCMTLAAAAPNGCSTFDKKKDNPSDPAKKKKDEKPKETIKDVSNDPSFQSFVGRLRVAVAQKDRRELAQMITPNFGYRWDEVPAGETPFDYWDKTNAWPELEALLSGRFVPHESYMVAPARFATESSFTGYRVGIRQVNGSWKMAYFVTGQEILP